MRTYHYEKGFEVRYVRADVAMRYARMRERRWMKGYDDCLDDLEKAHKFMEHHKAALIGNECSFEEYEYAYKGISTKDGTK